LILLPSITFASIGSDLNKLFNSFFGSGQEPVDDTPIEKNSNNDLTVPKIEKPKIPTEDELQKIQELIFLEESTLEDFNNQIEEQESQLWSLSNRKKAIQTQLQQLDMQINLNDRKLKKYKASVRKWEKILEKITRHKSDIKAELRIREEEYQRLMSRSFIRDQQFKTNDDISLVKWLFSQKTVAQILEEKQIQRYKQNQLKQNLQALNRLKKELEAEEKQSATLFGTLSSLRQKIAREKLNLQTFASGRANLLDKLAKSEVDLQQEIRNYRRQKNESAVYLQNLHLTLDKTREKLRQQNEDPEAFAREIEKQKKDGYSFFQWPFTKEHKIRVTAYFHDPEYKKTMGRDHDGLDLFSPQGSDLLAPADGIVKKIGLNNYGYSYLILEHKNGLYTVYGHLSDILVNKGQKVKQGDLIGKTGGTPGTKGAGYFTTGPHLHLEVFRDGRYLNPLHYFPKIKP